MISEIFFLVAHLQPIAHIINIRNALGPLDLSNRVAGSGEIYLASESDAEGRIDLGDSIGTCGWDSMIFNSLYVAMNQCSPCHNHWNFLPSQK